MNQDKTDLVKRINEKKREAFHELFLEFHSYLVVFAMRRVNNYEIAEDIVQETFLTVWENKKTYNSFTGLKAWLYELVLNKSLNHLKHKTVENRYLSSLSSQELKEDTFFNLTQEEVYRFLYLAVRQLPEKCRAVFELHLEGKKNEEISQILGISVLTVKSHKQHAIQLLKQRMGKLFTLFLLLPKEFLNPPVCS